MLEAIKKVRATLASKDIVQHFAHYLVRDGYVYASDGRATAAAPFPVKEDIEFLVRGEQFEKVLDRMTGEVKLTVEKNGVRLTSGRFRGLVKTLDPSIISYPNPQGKMIKCPADFLEVVKTLRPFIAEDATRPWALSIWFNGKDATATSNVSMATMPCKIKLNGLLPVWAADYILGRQETLTHIQQGDGYMAFRWEDGSWFSTRMMEGQFPEAVHNLLKGVKKPKWKVTKDWLVAFERVASLSENAIHLYADKMTGGGQYAEVEDAADTPVPKDTECTIWDPRYLAPVLAIAERIDFKEWPDPVSWEGNGARGLVIGRRV